MGRDDIPMPPHGSAPASGASGLQPRSGECRWCGLETPTATLAALGARCGPCFDAYVRAQQPRPIVATKYPGPRGWAYRLQTLEGAGVALSPAQAALWREALRNPQRPADAGEEIAA